MDGISERIENRCDILIHRRMMAPDIRHRQRNIFGKGPRAVDADALHLRAEMPSACKAIAAMAANHVSFSADNVTWKEVGDVSADLHNLADELMANHKRHRNSLLRPIIPLINVEIGSANARASHSNEHIVDADSRSFHIFKP